MNSQPKIALTMGDPAGVGPELCVFALNDAELQKVCTPIVFGDANVLSQVAKTLQQPFDPVVISLDQWSREHAAVTLPTVVDRDCIAADEFQPGVINSNTGAASFVCIEAAIEAALAAQVAAVTTAPINKKALNLAGVDYPGHTEIFAERAKSDRWCMMQYSEPITCTFVTVHCGYAEVPALLTTIRVLDVIELSADALLRIRGRSPQIVVCGLNPHAGEQSLFGNGEEERIILPAIESARARGLQVEGPLPPDTAFLPWKREAADVFVCMYHDQGHIPVKALAFDEAVNTTLGLPMIRTSVDHGTALDIAWQGKVNPGSLTAALKLAASLASG